MGSPFLCLWAILAFATIEMLVLMPKCRKNTIVFKRHIDDIFVIWRKQVEYDDSFN